MSNSKSLRGQTPSLTQKPIGSFGSLWPVSSANVVSSADGVDVCRRFEEGLGLGPHASSMARFRSLPWIFLDGVGCVVVGLSWPVPC